MRCLLFALVTATLRSQVSPVQKVIQLLDELRGKVEAELAGEEKLMAEYNSYCDEESNTREDAITAAKRSSTDLEATIQDMQASVGALTGEIDELAGKIRTNDADLEAATEIRDKERKSFEAREKELSDTVDTVERAVIVLKRGQTFLQSSKGTKELKMLAASLQAIISASWVSSKQKSAVQALLQDQDEDLDLQPQATTAAYESKGGSIVAVLQDMQAKAEEALSDLRKDEMEASHEYAMLKQGLDTATGTMSKRKAQASNDRSRDEDAQHSAEGDLAETKDGLKADKAFLSELKASCEAKGKEWDVRQKEAGEEMGAIAKAKEILQEGVKSFIQQSQSGDQARQRATDVLRRLQKQSPSFALAQVVSAAQADPFGKVRDLVEGLIERLLAEAGEEADAKAFCDTETKKSAQRQQELTTQVDKHAVRIEKSTAHKAALAQKIKQRQAEIGDIDKQDAEAVAFRQKEHEAYLEASAEYKQSAEAVANAMQVLQEYYAQGSFLQTGAKQAPEFGGAKTDVSSTILEMLEVAEADFTRLLAETEAAENEAVAQFEKLQQDNKVSRAAKAEEKKGQESEVKSLELGLLNYKDDHAAASKELDAVLAYQDKLKPQCETKVMSYEERVQKREQEIAGLKEALAILS